MTQHANVHQEVTRYSRTDFTALRAWVQRIPIAKVSDLYYAEESPQVQHGLEKFLMAMRQDLIERAIVANPKFAEMLAKARQGGAITTGVLDVLVQVANAKPNTPALADHIGQWLRAKVATQLVKEGIQTLADLKAYIEDNGPSWWRPIPRVGALRAQAISAWLNRTPETAINPATQALALTPQNIAHLQTNPLPLERIAMLPSELDGCIGENRSALFCYLSARNDLEAVQSYIQKFRKQPHTARAYQRELERFLLWAILIRKKPLSSTLVDDCEAYKDFLENPTQSFTGPRRGRFTPQWRPFTGPLSPESQKQAVQILRTAFSWLHGVRYLGGNPWVAVSDPRIDQQLHEMQIEKALPFDLYEKTVAILIESCQPAEATQPRIALATLLLLGDSGLRISEAASVTGKNLVPSSFTVGRFQLKVLGKRKKLRLVPITPRTHEAIKAHQADVATRYPNQVPAIDHALIRPITLPHSKAIQGMHVDSGKGYAANALARVLTKCLKAIAGLDSINVDEMIKLRTTSAHGLRHTYGTAATEGNMPIDVVQSILGHASISTTSIYIQAQERRVAAEAEKLLDKHNRSQASVPIIVRDCSAD